VTEENQVSYEFNTNLSSLESLIMGTYYNVINYEQVKKWLKDYIANNREIRRTSRFLYSSNGIYTNVIDYMVALPTLDRVIYSLNRNHIRFKKNKDMYLLALRKMKDKLIARDILHKLAVDGTSFYYFETTESQDLPKYMNDIDIEAVSEINSEFNCSAIPLPIDYCRIIGRKNSSYVVAFDVSYFDQFLSNGLSLKLKRFPKEIREHYKNYKKDLNKKWAVLDNNKTICTKVRANIDERWGRPVGLSAFIDMLYDEYFIDTKRNILDEINSTIVYQTFPEGETKGTSSLSQKQQKQQHDNIKGALFSRGSRKGLNFFSVASGTKLDKITTNVDFLKAKGEDELIKRISTNLGFAGSALNGQDGNFSSQQTNIEMVSAEIFAWLEQIQEEFNKVINANLIKDSKVFVEVYYLPITHVNRKQMVGNMKDLYTSGRGSLTAWIASTGFNPEAYLSMMDYELEEKFDEKYPVHATSFTMSNKDGKDAGRPSDDLSQNENTIKSKTNGSNENPN
jgi:hypothetical protein